MKCKYTGLELNSSSSCFWATLKLVKSLKWKKRYCHDMSLSANAELYRIKPLQVSSCASVPFLH